MPKWNFRSIDDRDAGGSFRLAGFRRLVDREFDPRAGGHARQVRAGQSLPRQKHVGAAVVTADEAEVFHGTEKLHDTGKHVGLHTVCWPGGPLFEDKRCVRDSIRHDEDAFSGFRCRSLIFCRAAT
jgi:hypothetical protein